MLIINKKTINVFFDLYLGAAHPCLMVLSRGVEKGSIIAQRGLCI